MAPVASNTLTYARRLGKRFLRGSEHCAEDHDPTRGADELEYPYACGVNEIQCDIRGSGGQ